MIKKITQLAPALLAGILTTAEAEATSIELVYKADTKRILNKSVRYYQTLDSPCIYIQVLKPGGRGANESQFNFCSIDGKSFQDDYSEVILESASFTSVELFFNLKIFPLELTEEKYFTCRATLDGNRITPPSCKRTEGSSPK